MVRLISSDGAVVELRPLGYQFSHLASVKAAEPGSATGSYDWDANWLVIRGDIRASDGRSWSFTDPCLATWEAESLARWLHAVASDDETASQGIVFTEPNLSFALDGVKDGRARMRVRFSHESLPGWLPREADGWQAGEHYVALEVTCADLAEAARAWDSDRLQFPAR